MEPCISGSYIKKYADYYIYSSNLAKGIYTENWIKIHESRHLDDVYNHPGQWIAIADEILYFFRDGNEPILDDFGEVDPSDDDFDNADYPDLLDSWIGSLDLKTGKLLEPLAKLPAQVESLVIHDHKLFCLSSLNYESTNVFILELHTGKLLDTVPFKDTYTAFTVADGKIFLGMEDGKILIYDLMKKEFLRPVEGHAKLISCLTVAENKLFSGSHDDTVRVWNLETNDCLITLECENSPTYLQMSDDLELIVGYGYVSDVWNWEKKVRKYTFDNVDSWDSFVVAKGKQFCLNIKHDRKEVTNGRVSLGILNCKASDDEILKNIFYHLCLYCYHSDLNPQKFDLAFSRFVHMPTIIKNKVYEELYLIISQDAFFLTEEQIKIKIDEIKSLIEVTYGNSDYLKKVEKLSAQKDLKLRKALQLFMKVFEQYINKQETKVMEVEDKSAT